MRVREKEVRMQELMEKIRKEKEKSCSCGKGGKKQAAELEHSGGDQNDDKMR